MCKKAPLYSYCKKDPENSCLAQLLNNNTAKCPTTHADEVTMIEAIQDGIIIARGENITIEDNAQHIVLNGSFLITFRSKIKVNGKEYYTNQSFDMVHLTAPKKTMLDEVTYNHKISLPYLHKLHFLNNQKINEFKATLETSKWMWYAITGILAILILVLLYAKIKPKKITITTNAEPEKSKLDKEAIRMSVLNIMNEDVQI